VIVAGGSKINGLWFETWRNFSRSRFVGYCSSVVWKVRSFGGLVEILVRSSMLCGKFPTMWMDFQWLVIVIFDGCSLSALAWTL
jgi:hypothetical protein